LNHFEPGVDTLFTASEQLEEKEKALAELRSRLINALNKVGQPCVDVF
jgi:hypothetical protein